MNHHQPKKLKLETQSIRVLNDREVAQVVGGARPKTQPCCDLQTQLLNPFTNE